MPSPETDLATQASRPEPQRLSCKACSRKKIKCNRAFPCQPCQRTGTQCVAVVNQRLPRGRGGGRRKVDADLRTRINRLEELVETLESKTTDGPAIAREDSGTSDSKGTAFGYAAPDGPAQHLASTFWSSLNTEVQGLRDALEEDESSDDERETSDEGKPSVDFDFIISSPASVPLVPSTSMSFSNETRATLCSIYIRNFDPLFKVLHTPSLLAYTRNQIQYLDYKAGSLAVEALMMAIGYAAVRTMMDEECEQMFNMTQKLAEDQYRHACERALARADFLSSNDFACFQAFVIYLATLRTTDTSRRPWSLMAVMVRIGRALELHKDLNSSSTFDTQMRRRLWHHMRLIDLYTAADRGSDPVIAPGSYETPLPANVNDNDFWFGVEMPLTERAGITEVSFMLLTDEISRMVAKLHATDTNLTREREAIALEFNRIIQEKYMRYCNTDVPFQWFLKQIGEMCASQLVVVALRPMRCDPTSKPPAVDNVYVIHLSTNVLETAQRIHDEPCARLWRWFGWVQWHALAVVLAGLCSLTEGEVVERAWPIVNITYERFQLTAADSPVGMLRRPVERLMKRAQAVRAKAVNGDEPISLDASMSGVHLNSGGADRRVRPVHQSTLPANAELSTGGEVNVFEQSNDGVGASAANTANFGDLSEQIMDPGWVDWESFLADFSEPVDPDSASDYATLGSSVPEHRLS